MKKLKNIIIVLLLIAALVASYAGALMFIKAAYAPSGNFYMDEEIDGKSSDDDFFDMGFRDGKLYYDFQASSEQIQKSGIYEISQSGVKYITNEYNSIDDYFKGKKPEPMDDEYYEEEFDDEDEDDIEKEIKDLYRYKDKDEKYDDDEDDYFYTLYTVTDDDTVIYLSKDLYIKEVDLKTHKCLFKKKLKDNIINFDKIDSVGLWSYELRKYGGKILFVSDYLNGQFVVYNVNDNFSELFSKRLKNLEYFSYKYYKGKLFIGSDKGGIYLLNLKKNKSRQLSGEKAYDMYIFGDKWLYHTGRDGNLYRTAQDGSKTETLFKTGW